ncbi:MAG: alpha/beta fold hydrolase [Gammaproteobacteria bacterium]|nr:alpha/beta fold hydrolase [Gammaproteobacteria bacterium]
MANDPFNPEINPKVYDFCVRAFRSTRKLLKLNIKLHQENPGENSLVRQGDIFLFNHFSRFETFIPQYLIHEETGAYCRSVAAAEFFDGDDRFSQFLYDIGVVPNDLPHLFPFLVREILHDRKLIVFPEGGMVKDKRVVDERGGYSVFSRSANERRKHHRGSAVIALALDAFKTALLYDYSKGRYDRIERWTEQLGFESTEKLMIKAIKPTIIVPSNITFYPIRVSDNILHQAARRFNKKIDKRFAEELIIEGNLLFKHTDMDIRFSRPLVMGNYWRWWEKRLLPNVVHSFDSLDELFELKTQQGHLGGRIHAFGMRAKSNVVRDDYMRSMYQAVTANLSHLASLIILDLFEQGLRRISCSRFHKMLYLAIKRLQDSGHPLHRSLQNPEEYAAIVNQGSSRLEQFLKTANSLSLVHVEEGEYVLDDKLISDFEIDEIRTENLIAVYANEVHPLHKITRIVDGAIADADRIEALQLAKLRFDDEVRSLAWDRAAFDRPRYADVNSGQTQTADARPFLLESNNKSASAVLLIHGFMAGPEELRSLGERLHARGHHVLGIRLKGHGTSPWDLRSRNWHDWAQSVARGFDIIKAYSNEVHIVGFSTGGLLALWHAAQHPQIRIKSVSSVSAPVHFRNKNMIFVPLLHHANALVSWVTEEGLVPFRPNRPENPHINYQHIPIRALYQLQQLIDHLTEDNLKINADVYLYQGNGDPVVEPSSVRTLEKNISAENLRVIMLESERHGVVYSNVDEVQEKICATLL